MWCWHEKARMGHTECISHSAQWLRWRSSATITTKFLVRVVLMWCWHEKARMGHTKRISHSGFWLKRRSSATITINFLSEGCRVLQPMGSTKAYVPLVAFFVRGRNRPLITRNYSERIDGNSIYNWFIRLVMSKPSRSTSKMVLSPAIDPSTSAIPLLSIGTDIALA